MDNKKFSLDFKFGGNIEFLTKLETLMSRVDKAFKSSESEIDKTTVKTSKFNKELQKTSVTANQVGDGFAGLGKKIKFFAASFIGIKTIGTALSSFREMESLKTDLGVMLGSEKEGDNFSNYIIDFAKKTPYAINQLSGLATGMIQYNIPLEKTKELMQIIGDISMGDAHKMGSLGLVTSQIAALGKLQGQDYKQMLNTGFNPLTIISEMSGKSMAVLTKEMSEGKISFEMVVDAMKYATSESGKFYKGMEKGAKTLSGIIATAKDNFMMQLAEGVDRNQESLKNLVNKIGELDFSKLISGFSDLASKAFPLVDKLASLLGIVSKIPFTFSLASSAFVALKVSGKDLSNVFGGIGQSISKSSDKLKDFNKISVGASVAGGVMAGLTNSGDSSKSESENTVSALSAVAVGAAAGAVQFGALGAAIGAASAALTMLISVSYKYHQQQKDAEAFKKNEENKQKDFESLIRQRKRALNGEAGGWVDYERSLMSYEKKYGSLESSYLTSHRSKDRVAESKNNQTLIQQINSNNVTQNNNIEASIDRLDLLLNASLRKLIESKTRIAAETQKTMGAL